MFNFWKIVTNYPDMNREDVDAVKACLVAVVANQFADGPGALCFVVDLEQVKENQRNILPLVILNLLVELYWSF